jgi:hypothetical protein
MRLLAGGLRRLVAALRSPGIGRPRVASSVDREWLNRLARVDVLVIDEMGYLNLRPEQTNIFFKLMEER